MTVNLTDLVKRGTYQASLITSDIKEFQDLMSADSILFVDITNDINKITTAFAIHLCQISFKRTGTYFADLNTSLSWMNEGQWYCGIVYQN